MAQQVTPVRAAGLGRAICSGSAAVGGVVLLLPRGVEVSARRPAPLTPPSLYAFGRALVRAGRADGLTAHVVRYRSRGWNGAQAQLAHDAADAADAVLKRYGDVPVCLVGAGMGGRAALHAGGHDAVQAVVALAPWLPEDDVAVPPEPVKQLQGRRVLIVHGTNDDRSDPELSFRLAARVKKTNRDMCRFEVHSDGHGLRQYRSEVTALTVDFVLGSLFGRPFSRPVQDALAAPPPLGLRMPLASGFRGASAVRR